MLAALSPARRRLLLTIAGAVAAALVAVVTWKVVDAATASKRAAAPQDQPGPVLLVPGYGGSTSALTQLAGALRAHGRDARVVQVPDGGTGDLRTQARALATAAEAALADTKQRSVDVVGYSAGGVVARLWAREFAGAGEARRIVTLGSPQHGTDVAALAGSVIGCPVACQQLVPDSDLLNTLNAKDETPDGPVWVSIWSDVDQVVVPPDSARLDGAMNLTVQSICASSRVSHGELPTDKIVTNVVLAELDAASTTTFASADCARLSA